MLESEITTSTGTILKEISDHFEKMIEVDVKIQKAEERAQAARSAVVKAYSTSNKADKTLTLERHGNAIKSIEEVLESTMDIQKASLKYIELLLSFSDVVFSISATNAATYNIIVQKLKQQMNSSDISTSLKEDVNRILQSLEGQKPLYIRLNEIEERLKKLEEENTNG